jgi:hypothetical protein
VVARVPTRRRAGASGDAGSFFLTNGLSVHNFVLTNIRYRSLNKLVQDLSMKFATPQLPLLKILLLALRRNFHKHFQDKNSSFSNSDIIPFKFTAALYIMRSEIVLSERRFGNWDHLECWRIDRSRGHEDVDRHARKA